MTCVNMNMGQRKAILCFEKSLSSHNRMASTGEKDNVVQMKRHMFGDDVDSRLEWGPGSSTNYFLTLEIPTHIGRYLKSFVPHRSTASGAGSSFVFIFCFYILN